MAGLIDEEAELARLNKALSKLEKEIEISEKKLSNPNFSDKAPVDVVEKEKERLEQSRQAMEKLMNQRKLVESIQSN